jgi:hypothetical protein
LLRDGAAVRCSCDANADAHAETVSDAQHAGIANASESDGHASAEGNARADAYTAAHANHKCNADSGAQSWPATHGRDRPQR